MRLIDADVAIKILDEIVQERAKNGTPYEVLKVQLFAGFTREVINSQSTIDAESVRHGHWIKNDNGTYSCSLCQSWIHDEQHYYARYCLHCGAKMDGERREKDDL